MTDFDRDRRKILKAGAAGLSLGLAGCIGPFADTQGVPGTTDPSEESESNGEGDDGGTDPATMVDEYLTENSANGYDGSIKDMTGQDSITIENGANEPEYEFGPAAVRVDVGTEITWEWASDGHSVRAVEGGDFDSGIENEGFTWSNTFEESGVVLYECQPHAAVGQIGAIIVGDGGSGGGGGSNGAKSQVDEYLADANGYDGSIKDMTGQGSITIENGANEPNYEFGPAAVRVDVGTEITWEWASDGHSVRAVEGGDFDSGIENEGFTWSYTFDEPGVVLYECQPHAAVGQLGAVVVEGESDSGGDGGEAASQVDEYLADANGYDGSIKDMTGQGSITIENGANEPNYEFGPAAVRVDVGTEITWEWASDGHSVRAVEGGDFDSGIENEGFTWSYTFDEPGVVLYECQPHAALGQLGAVVVEGESDSGGDGSDSGGDGGEAASRVDEYLADANGYDGSIKDMTGQDSVSVENGVNEPNYAFGPSAIRVDSGTEVTWEWVSAGHSVAATEGADFDSGIEGEGFTWSYTFEESGVVLYECQPHSAVGQLGAVIVE
ncbi:halocyanin domain-containing protein [Halovenus rubra]|uniref:Halocyanin domain-containing protein n=2 Tax=Halovenus rubra TaxID=869890 RepID=A0ACC7DY04_9EURY|nr:halocyanin domain-containing protein [Halovenus rubra]